MNGNVLRVAAAAVIGVLLLGGGYYLFGGGVPNVGGRPTPSPSSTVAPSGGVKVVQQAYTARPGWILLEHFGANAPDGSGPATGPDGRSLWLIRADGSQLHELAPGIPLDGKIEPDWSPDGSHVVFGTVDPKEVIYETDLDGAASQVVSA
ncbi:MAG TPA: hypothetical protein VMT36_05405, partial [Candidatus Saccharimonadia bacterium]|nr:hypothetical protein [Candidatus Saccharimonadia bacterium]